MAPIWRSHAGFLRALRARVNATDRPAGLLSGGKRHCTCPLAAGPFTFAATGRFTFVREAPLHMPTGHRPIYFCYMPTDSRPIYFRARSARVDPTGRKPV